MGWSAARLEHRRREWKSSRELAVEPDRWAITVRCERGYTKLLPDLAVWLRPDGPPVALVAESGHRREDRQKWILEGWRDAIIAGRYAGLRYDCATDAATKKIERLAEKIALTRHDFGAYVQATAEEIAAIDPTWDGVPMASADAPLPPPPPVPPAADRRSAPTARRPDPSLAANPAKRPAEPQAPKRSLTDAERQAVLRDVLGVDDGEPRRRWRR